MVLGIGWVGDGDGSYSTLPASERAGLTLSKRDFSAHRSVGFFFWRWWMTSIDGSADGRGWRHDGGRAFGALRERRAMLSPMVTSGLLERSKGRGKVCLTFVLVSRTACSRPCSRYFKIEINERLYPSIVKYNISQIKKWRMRRCPALKETKWGKEARQWGWGKRQREVKTTCKPH